MDALSELDTLLNTSTNPAPAPVPAAPAPAAEPAPAAAPVPAVTTPAPATPSVTPPAVPEVPVPAAPEEDPEQIFNGSKQNATFAQMRKENKQLRTTTARLAKTIGVDDTTDLPVMLAAINQKLMEFESKESNIPLPVLQQLETTKQQQQDTEQDLRRTNAHAGFQAVQQKYSLEKADVNAFAQQLLDAGHNPFAEDVDIMREYQMLNFDKILTQERDAAAQEVVARQKKAEQHSSTPSSIAGAAAPTSATTISSITDLDSMLNGLVKK